MEKYIVRYEDRGRKTKVFYSLYSAAVFWEHARAAAVLDINGVAVDEDTLWEAIASYDYLYR